MDTIPPLTLLLAAAAAVTGCSPDAADTPSADASASAPPPALTSVFEPVPAADISPAIPELRRTARPGDDVVIEAKVMGTKHPFVDNRAVFVVGDEGTLTSCDLRHDDACPTPWDNCCDDPEAVRAGTATIQVVDESGEVLRHGIKGIAGLEELSRLRIEGRVAPASTEAAFIINAARIEVL